MNVIKNKLLPIFYSDEADILYFDSLEDFDPSDYNFDKFKYLKKTRKNTTPYFFSEYYIDFKKLPDDEKQDKGIHKFIRNLRRKIMNNDLEFGVFIGSDENFNFKSDFKDEMLYYKFEDTNLMRRTTPVVTSNNFKGFLDVGQGLSFVDETKNFIYDAGGSKPWNQYKNMIDTTIDNRYTVVISHCHYDHFKYIGHMFDNIKELYFAEKAIMVGKKIKKLFDDFTCKGKIKVMKNDDNIDSYVFCVPYQTDDLNESSIIAWNEEEGIMLTGDTTYEVIADFIQEKRISKIKDFLIPHHTSDQNGDWTKLKEITIDKSYASFGVNKRYNHHLNNYVKEYFRDKSQYIKIK